YSALRILEDAGLIRTLSPGGQPAPPRVRLIASAKRITRELGETGRDEELRFVRRLWQAGGGAEVYRGAEVAWRLQAAMTGGRGGALSLLAHFEEEGFLEWSPPPQGEGIQVLDRGTPVQRLALDWRRLDSRRQGDLSKLKKMQGYAYHEGCRRGFVLRYFGDPEAMEECGACDNCRSDAPLAEVEAPAPRPAGRQGARREREPIPE